LDATPRLKKTKDKSAALSLPKWRKIKVSAHARANLPVRQVRV